MIDNMRVYIASGWFNKEQQEDLDIIKKCLGKGYFDYFSPKDEFICSPTADNITRQKTFDGNIGAIDNCSLMIVNTRDKDLGSIFEAGYGYAKNKKIIYFCRGLKGQFNLMLSQSGIAIATSETDLINILDRIKGDPNFRQEYLGDIE